jgi:cobalt-zinc-cadmium resistance protein CzcA
VQQIAGAEQYFGAGKRFSYITAGVSIPIFSRSIAARAAAAKTDWQRSRAEADYTLSQLQTAISQAFDQVRKYTTGLQYYEHKGLHYAEQIINAADEEFKAGEIDYLQWVLLVDQAISIRTAHLNMLEQYNTAVVELLKLTNQ